MNIQYVNGDATQPCVAEQMAIVVHICNDLGKWGKGFVLAISRKWELPEKVYRQSFDSSTKPNLGDVQFVRVEPNIVIANLIGQHGVRTVRSSAIPPIRYAAVREGLHKIAEYAIQHDATVHMPRIGCGLAGGRWDEIEPLIYDELISKKIQTTVYDIN